MKGQLNPVRQSRAPKALLVLDVEGTLFESTVRLPGTNLDSTIWQAVARSLGPDAEREEIETHTLWDSGAYGSYIDWMTATIDIHVKYGLKRDLFDTLVAEARYCPDVAATMATLDRDWFEPVLVSGGFRELARRAQRDFAVKHAFAACEYIFDDHGVVAGYNLLPCDFAGKLDFVRLLLREYRLSKDDWVFVGDGLNDVPIATAAPFSVGYRPHPRLAEVVDAAISDFAELPTVLQRSAVGKPPT